MQNHTPFVKMLPLSKSVDYWLIIASCPLGLGAWVEERGSGVKMGQISPKFDCKHRTPFLPPTHDLPPCQISADLELQWEVSRDMFGCEEK